MGRPSSRHLSHDFPAWKGLSLRELFWIVVSTTPVCTVFFTFLGVFIGAPLALSCSGLLIGFILAITVWPKGVARFKKGKPYGYVMKQCMQWMVRLRLKQSPWIHYQGLWQKNKSIGEHHV